MTALCWLVLSASLFVETAEAKPTLQPPKNIPADFRYTGPDDVKVDILRAGGDPLARTRIFVQAVFPDGTRGLFMVDTGAAVSVLSEDTAERLGLSIERDWASVQGLGGQAAFHRAQLPTLQLGDATINNVDVAVGVPGVPENAGFMPLDGILGNNIWGRFVLEIDYPADLIVLHRPGTFKMPKTSTPIHFDGHAVYTAIGVNTDDHQSATIGIQLDTGAGGLMIAGADALPFDSGSYSQGLEGIYGIGAADTMPSNVFLRNTRHIPLASVDLGGRNVKTGDLEARWLNYEGSAVGPTGMPGLAGHELFADYDTIFDYQGGLFALTKSHHKKREIDGHDVLLAQDIEKYGPTDAQRGLYRAKMLASHEKWPEADKLLEGFLLVANAPEQAEDVAEARVLLASIRRIGGDLDGAWKAIEVMSPTALVSQGEIVAAANGLALDGHIEQARALATSAIADYTEAAVGKDYEATMAASAWVALADVQLAAGESAAANDTILQTMQLLDNPDAHLLRRARIALASGDRYGAMAEIRRLLQLYPSNGQYLWFYATLLDSDADRDTFRADMDAAMARLHTNDRPLDYMVHAYHLLGDQAQAETLLAEGLKRDCPLANEASSRDNCTAWYYAMAGVEPDLSLKLVDRAIAAEGPRADFLDTKAMVHLSRGEVEQAHTAALAAARLSPDEIYMLWQAERIDKLTREPATGVANREVPH